MRILSKQTTKRKVFLWDPKYHSKFPQMLFCIRFFFPILVPLVFLPGKKRFPFAHQNQSVMLFSVFVQVLFSCTNAGFLFNSETVKMLKELSKSKQLTCKRKRYPLTRHPRPAEKQPKRLSNCQNNARFRTSLNIKKKKHFPWPHENDRPQRSVIMNRNCDNRAFMLINIHVFTCFLNSPTITLHKYVPTFSWLCQSKPQPNVIVNHQIYRWDEGPNVCVAEKV